jgi:hypothetical protein
MKSAIVPIISSLLLAMPALAQPGPQPPAPALAGVAAGQQTDVTGIVKQFALTPAGDIEGLVLTNGTEVHVPPHLSAEVAAAVHPGEAVAVRGWAIGIPDFFVATALTGQRGQSAVDQGPPPPGPRPPPPAPAMSDAQRATVQGRVQQLLYGPAGDVNGAMLDDGTTLKAPPPAWTAMASLVQRGQTVAASGWVLSNAYGRVMDVQAIGTSPSQLTEITPGPGPGRPMGPPPPPPAVNGR